MRKPGKTAIATMLAAGSVLAVLSWSIIDAPEDTGIRVVGHVVDCEVIERANQCVVVLTPSNKQVWVFKPFAKRGDLVTLKEMKRPIFHGASYAISF
ncbi:hypothetical protein [Rhodanobacter sp. L36]|uniref:hypothetical protein n=1 Tax=Rhodanobacter sp. L36 TaxID=1747221 RepID=UPI00131BF688|nr:hypothetical protein [Rhodanobacter sp. L36]